MSIPVKAWGNVSYEDLSPESKVDVVMSISYITREPEEDVRVGLENGPTLLPLVFVSPKLIYDPERGHSQDMVEEYRTTWARRGEFPPVTIDSSQSPLNSLLEGGHRVASAVAEGVTKILAIDLAGVHVVKTKDGLETYDFKGTRRKR